MNNRFLVVIAPNGNLHVTSVDNKGHALRLIEYFDTNNISYNKEDAIYTTSQEFVKGYKDNDLIKEKGGINYAR